MRQMKRRGGYTLIELVLVLLLLTFVAVAVFLLTDIGSAAYTRLSASRDQAADLRIGLSYMDVRLKKIDGSGSISIRPAPFGGGQALVLAQRIDGTDYETQLYVDRGMLRELFVKKGLVVTADMASEIARADSLDIRFINDRLLALTLTRGKDATAASTPATGSAATGSAATGSAATGSAATGSASTGSAGTGSLERATQWVYLRAAREVKP